MAERYGSEDTSQPSAAAERASTPKEDEVDVVLTRAWGNEPVGKVVRVSKVQAKSLIDHMMGDDTPEAVRKAKAGR